MRYNFPLDVHGEEAALNGFYSFSRAVSVVHVFSASLDFISPDPLSRPVGGNPWALGILLWCLGRVSAHRLGLQNEAQGRMLLVSWLPPSAH